MRAAVTHSVGENNELEDGIDEIGSTDNGEIAEHSADDEDVEVDESVEEDDEVLEEDAESSEDGKDGETDESVGEGDEVVEEDTEDTDVGKEEDDGDELADTGDVEQEFEGKNDDEEQRLQSKGGLPTEDSLAHRSRNSHGFSTRSSKGQSNGDEDFLGKYSDSCSKQDTRFRRRVLK